MVNLILPRNKTRSEVGFNCIVERSTMKVLHLTLKKCWFDMIASGDKKEEYRESKPYWTTRLANKDFDVIRFRNGYAKDAPTMIVDCLGMGYGLGNPEWGASNKPVFILKLGDILSA